jgi:hypothetical protein
VAVRRIAAVVMGAALVATVLTACGSGSSASTTVGASTTVAASTTVTDGHAGHGDHPAGATISDADRIAAQLATAGFQDVATAEAAGWASTLDTLGCFQDAANGGMGVHYVNAALMDATVDVTQPEGLVYELDAAGHIAGLVAHEYIVPVEAWTASTPPELFGQSFHRHPTLPLWVLHAWLWKDDPAGVFNDWNPAVRQCPAGVPIFGVDRP